MSILKFLGSGSAFNTKLGNTSAYYKHGNQMLLIDCGSNIFHRIKESGVLEGVEHIHTLITHTHADHVGSLADLILYTYYSHGEFAKPKVTIYSLNATGVKEVLKLNGCVEDIHFDFVNVRYDNIINITPLQVLIMKPIETNHVDELSSFGYELVIEGKGVYYSGDTKDINKEDLEWINKGFFPYVYIDTCKADYEGNVHISLRKLAELIKPEHREKVYCMHLDEGFVREEAESLGFNVVENEF